MKRREQKKELVSLSKTHLLSRRYRDKHRQDRCRRPGAGRPRAKPYPPVLGVCTVRHRGIGTGISEASKRVPILPFATQRGKQESSVTFLFSTGELGQNLKAQTRPPGAVPEPWMISDVILTLPARVRAQASRFQSYRNDHPYENCQYEPASQGR